MISNESLELLRSAIVVFDELEGNDYLLAYSSSKKQPLNFLNIRIEKKNFWHLLGCKVSGATDFSHTILYEMCIKGLIGYSKKDEFYFPKTTQSKSIYEIDKNANNKIVYIMGKEFHKVEYSKLEYEIVEGIAAQDTQLKTLN